MLTGDLLGHLLPSLSTRDSRVDKRTDGTLFYSNVGIGQLIVAPAYKLRPGDDPVVRRIPSDVRRRILELEPVSHQSRPVLPRSGVPLSVQPIFLLMDLIIVLNAWNLVAQQCHRIELQHWGIEGAYNGETTEVNYA